jgi:hypothetical protein
MEGKMDSPCYDMRFPIGSTHLLVGSAGAGKTERVIKMLLLKDSLFQNGDKIKNVIFCYAVWQPAYERLKNVVTKWVNRMVTNEEFISLVKPYQNAGGSICVLDDFLFSSYGKSLSEICCVSARHHNTCLFILFQTLFPKDKEAALIPRNVKYMHIQKNPREGSAVRYLAAQLYPGNFRWIVNAYHKATEEPFSCFLVDLTQNCPESMRFRSHYLPDEAPMRVWRPVTRSIL